MSLLRTGMDALLRGSLPWKDPVPPATSAIAQLCSFSLTKSEDRKVHEKGTSTAFRKDGLARTLTYTHICVCLLCKALGRVQGQSHQGKIRTDQPASPGACGDGESVMGRDTFH